MIPKEDLSRGLKNLHDRSLRIQNREFYFWDPSGVREKGRRQLSKDANHSRPPCVARLLLGVDGISKGSKYPDMTVEGPKSHHRCSNRALPDPPKYHNACPSTNHFRIKANILGSLKV